MLFLNDEFIVCIGTSKTECLAAYMRDDDAMARLYRTAERGARLPRESLIARELVAEVIEDQLADQRPWSFASASTPEEFHRRLHLRLSRTVEKRARRLSEGKGGLLGGKGRSEPRALSLDDRAVEALAIKLATVDGEPHAALDRAALVARIRELARGDDDVEQLLDLYDREVVARRAILRAAGGMTKWRYRRARERLLTYAVAAVRETTRTEMNQLKTEDPESIRLAVKLVFGSRAGSAR